AVGQYICPSYTWGFESWTLTAKRSLSGNQLAGPMLCSSKLCGSDGGFIAAICRRSAEPRAINDRNAPEGETRGIRPSLAISRQRPVDGLMAITPRCSPGDSLLTDVTPASAISVPVKGS